MQRKFILLILVFTLLIGSIPISKKAEAKSCPELQIIFARGANEPQWTGENYLAYKKSLEAKLQTTTLDYNFIDLDYHPIDTVTNRLYTSVEKSISVNELYDFEGSISEGAKKLTELVSMCPNSKYIISGYSEGATVVIESIKHLDSENIIYAAAFGDPKLYLPEGKGVSPIACDEQNLSNYRTYVSDCRTYEGILGATNPYQPESYLDKLGAWCHKSDAFCSPHINISDHYDYAKGGVYDHAANIIFEKIANCYKLDTHDTLNEDIGSTIFPKVDENINSSFQKAVLEIKSVEELSKTSVRVNFEIAGLSSGAIIVLENNVMGATNQQSFDIVDLKPNEMYELRLIPIKKSLFGDGINITIQTHDSALDMIIPKTPNTGQK